MVIEMADNKVHFLHIYMFYISNHFLPVFTFLLKYSADYIPNKN